MGLYSKSVRYWTMEAVEYPVLKRDTRGETLD